MNNKFKILIVGCAFLSIASLCSANQAPPVPVAEKVIVFDDAPVANVSLNLALCDFSLKCDQQLIERDAVTYVELIAVVTDRASVGQALTSAEPRTCSRLTAPLAKHSTVAELRQPKAGKEPAARM